MRKQKDKWSADTFSLVPSDSICANCKHYINAGECEAFEEIPEDILYGGAKHYIKLPNQKNDIVFEPMKE